jgi:catechol 2,3-dioxygenase-like lactoylglutathione lyase family enzyme
MTVEVTGVHHIGIVVDNLAEAARFLEQTFGLTVVDRIDREDLKALFYECGATQIELIELLDPAARAARLGSDAARIEHVALGVGDLATALNGLRTLGVDATPPRDAGGRQSSWTVPATSDGVIYQLIELGEGPGVAER